MSSLGGSCSVGNFSRSRCDGLHGLVDAQGGLREPDDLVLVAHGDLVHRVGVVDELDVVGSLTGGADHLLVALVADEQDVVVVAGEALGLVVHLGHQRAGGVDDLQAAGGGGLVDGRGDAVGGEHHDRALGHLVVVVDEDGARLGQGLHHMLVVHDLVAHVDRGAVFLQGPLDGFHGAVHACAVAARLGQQDALLRSPRSAAVLDAPGIPMLTVGGMVSGYVPATQPGQP